MRQLSGQDSAFVYLEAPGVPLHLTGLYVYEQPGVASGDPADDLDLAAITSLITNALDRVTELRQRLLRPPLDVDYPIWVEDTGFVLADHLHAFRGPAPRSRKALYSTVAAIHAEPLDLEHAPWEMHIIERLNGIPGLPVRCFGIVMKNHHAAIDGASGAALIDRMHGVLPHDVTQITTHKARRAATRSAQRKAVPGTTEMLVRAVYNNAANAVSLIRTLAETTPGLVRKKLSAPAAHLPLKQVVPKTRFNGPVSTQRVMHAMTVDLERLRALRQLVAGATINDVVLALCGGALRNWLESCGELPAESLVAMVPVNTRAEHESSIPGNRISSLFVPIGTNIDNPAERLRFVHQATRRSKSGEHGLEPRQLGAISRHLPALPLSLVARLVTGLGLGYRGPRLCNCTITNVPSHAGELYLGPARLVYKVGNGPLIDGMGLIISIFTHSGKTHLVFTSCPEMLPDPAALAKCAEQSLRLMEKAAKEA